MKKLFIYLLSLCAIISCLQEERSPEEILVPTLAKVDSTESSLMFTSKVPKGTEKLVEGCGFYYGTDKSLADATKVEASMDVNNFAVELPERNYGTTYYICSYITNGHGSEIRSEVSSYSLKDLDEYVDFGKVSIVSYEPMSKQLSVKFELEIDPIVVVSQIGVCYGEKSTGLTVDGDYVKGKISEEGYVTVLVEGLEPETQYYFRPYLKDGKHISYDAAQSLVIPSIPVAVTSGVDNVTSESAELSGEILSGTDIIERGFVWTSDQSVPTIDSYRVKVDGTLGKYSAVLTDLTPSVKYAFRAYVKNNQGAFYGDILNFTTIAGIPTLAVTKVSDVKETSAIFTSSVTGHTGAVPTEVGFYYSTEEDVNVETAQKVSEAYSSDNFTLSVTGLEVGTTYYVKAFALNSAGEAQNAIVSFKTVSTAPSVTTKGYSKTTATSAELFGEVIDDNGEEITEQGFVWVKGSAIPTLSNNRIQATGTTGEYSAVFDDIIPNQVYSYRAYATNSKGTSYGDVMSLEIIVALPTVVTSSVSDITDNSAVCGGVITDDGGGDILAKGVVWSRRENPTIALSTKTDDGFGVSVFTSQMFDLLSGTTYYVRAYATNAAGTSYGEDMTFDTLGEHLECFEPANSFIVSQTGTYMFEAVKGNSSESVGSVASAEVLWESFGTSETPKVGSLVSSVSIQGNAIVFEVADPFREGNAVIVAKDASGTILWSWHIWLTDQPEEHVYNNNAGTMMDRNLGATSATPGDVGALGLLYQWGRKDPFLGSSSISSNTEAKSTITWPYAVSSDSSNGIIEYAIANPTTFITPNSSNYDWYYTGSSSTDDTRWQSEKTIYDPCPVGWRVPDGGGDGVWSKALGSSSSNAGTYDSTNCGMNFSGKFGSASTIWYPASGYRVNDFWGADDVGYDGYYWSVTPSNSKAYYLYFSYPAGNVNPSDYRNRAAGLGVRCFKEGTGGGPKYDNDFSTSVAISLSDSGTANSYIVSNAGTYSISAVKGNSSESVGSVASAEVLWESFGTDEIPSKGSLIIGAKYENGRLYFKTSDSYREGNAVIAAKDASGIILWSWHIWFTDQPEEQVYNNNAGTMMDRNLGATSATPGDVGALGLLYQWGRKDPFLGSSSISSDTDAKSTLTWPSAVSSNSSNGTIEYATSHPTTFIIYNNSNYDWYYTGSSSTDNTRWQSEKTIYDPCPVGWRVPDGGSEGIWSTALGSSSSYNDTFDGSNKGINFSGKFGSASTIWYPASGFRLSNVGELYGVGNYGYYWSVTPNNKYASSLYFISSYGNVIPSDDYCTRAGGFGVRCVQE